MSMPPPPPPGDQPFQPAGYPTPPQYSQPYGQPYGVPQSTGPQRMSGMAVAGFVLSLVGLIPCFYFWFLQVPGVLGTIFSVIGLKATSDRMRKGRGLAVAGLIIGLVAIAIAALFTLLVYTSDSCVVDGANIQCSFT